MRRRIIKQANQAFTITLPIKWIRQNNLSEKSEVDVQAREKSLVISSDSIIIGEKAKIEASNLSARNLARQINALYARGVDEIEIVSGKDISSSLPSLLNQNLGYALVKQVKNSFFIKDIGGGNYQDLDEIFKRVFQMILLFYDSAINDIFGKEKESLKSLIAREFEINKFCLYLQRAINKMSYPDIIKGRALFAYSFSLEKISDEIYRLWKTNIENKIKKTKVLKELAELSCEGLGKSFDLYYQFNSSRTEEIYDIRNKVRERPIAMSKLDWNALKLIKHIMKIAEDAADLSHLTLIINL